jgi:site-specific DNA recombinase
VEAEQVRAIFNLFLERQSLVGTAQELNRRGWLRKSWTTKKGTTREGSAWDRVTLRRLLGDPIYIGKTKLGGEVFPGEHDGIVPKAIFEKVLALLEGNGRNGNSGARNRSGAILRGLLRCAACDSAMTPAWTRTRDRLYRYYTCSKAMKQGHDTCPTKSVPAAEVEKVVVDRIRAIGKDPNICRETFRHALAQIATQRRGLKAEAKRIAGETGKVREEVHQVVGAVSEASNGAREALLAALEKAQQRLTTLENRAEEIRGQEETLKGCEVDEEEVAQTLAAFDPIWEVLHTPEKERILGLLIERVTYDGQSEELVLTFRPGGIVPLSAEMGTVKGES